MNTATLSRPRRRSFSQIIDDFRGLDPNDPGLWPMVPKITILAILLLAIVGASWWFDWQDQWAQLAQKQQEEQTLKTEWLNKKQQAASLDEYKKQLAEIDRQFGALLRQLPNKAEMEALLIDINQAGRGRGLKFELWKPGSESVKEFYAELPIALKVTGTYHDLGNFASDVAKLPRIVTLNDITIGLGKSADLEMNANAVTYRYLDEEELAQKKQREKAAKDKK